jgi:hypothetical protein
MNKIVFIPNLSDSAIERAKQFGSGFASCVNSSIKQFNELAEALPVEYQWVRMSDETFSDHIKQITSDDSENKVARINDIYWSDLLRQLESLMVMNCWRASDLARLAANLINRDELGVAAIISRSSLENSAFFLHASRKVLAIVDELRKQDFRESVVAGQEIEDFVTSAVFGSGKESKETDHNVAFNVLSAIRSIEKSYEKKNVEGIEEHYDVLSEVVHPNFTGRALYIHSDVKLENEGTYLTKICQSQGRLNDHILAASVAALSWAMGSQVSACDLMSGSIKTMNNVLKEL